MTVQDSYHARGSAFAALGTCTGSQARVNIGFKPRCRCKGLTRVMSARAGGLARCFDSGLLRSAICDNNILYMHSGSRGTAACWPADKAFRAATVGSIWRDLDSSTWLTASIISEYSSAANGMQRVEATSTWVCVRHDAELGVAALGDVKTAACRKQNSVHLVLVLSDTH